MSALAIDTLKLARRLRDTAGFTPEHAEAAAEAFADAVAGTALATKEHLDAKLFETKTDLKADILRLETKIEASKNDTLKAVMAMIISAVVVNALVIFGAVFGLAKMLHG
jgi:hypothetical protein